MIRRTLAQRDRMLDRLERRNQAILAHGFTPISADDWTAMQGWLEESFLPMLRAELTAVGMREPPPQLPRELEMVLKTRDIEVKRVPFDDATPDPSSLRPRKPFWN